MEKIVITGGLGYIGSELCKLYSGEARFKNITVIDKRFVAERVKQLRDWGINFVQASILDSEAMKEHLSDADVIIHLAGITDVAYVKTEANTEHDKEITETGITGTRNVIAASKPSCKIIFPSTHVVFEGFAETKLDITETEKPCPVLTYAQGKVQSEQDLADSNRNFVILRLASVYGYSTDTMRIGIMPNLFSKIASQNGTIKLFSGGIQLKSLVPIFDVVRCMKFMAENPNANREIYHLSKDSKTVKEVAKICQSFNPSLKIVETNDEIPNLGYTISNQKLLATGFKFLYTLEACIKQMIDAWSVKNINPDLEYIDRGGKCFRDERGKITNYELTEPINLIGHITSKAMTVRANHYHPVQEQKCLLVSGQYISVIKDLSVPNAPIKTRTINPGDIAIIKPNVAHAMVFTKDSVFLNLVRGEREHQNYGITHTIPYTLVDDEMKDKLLQTHKYECRSCGCDCLESVISLGDSPLANNLPDSLSEPVEQYPLEMMYCPDCHNCQLSVVVPPEKLFDNYLYVSSTTASFRKHFEEAANRYIHEFNLGPDSLVIDIGSNDGIALRPFHERGIPVLGVEPAANLAKMANESGIRTDNAYFTWNMTKKSLPADLILASNVFAHSDELKEMFQTVEYLLKENGTFVIEVQYLLDTIKDLTFDNIYHEHVNYWTVTSLVPFFRRLNGVVTKVEHIDTHGGSIRVYVQKITHDFENHRKNIPAVDSSVGIFLALEEGFGIKNFETYRKFGQNIQLLKETVTTNVAKLKAKYPVIAGYGSPAKATTALNYFGIDSTVMDYTIEDNKLKVGKYIPGVNIPIKDKAHAMNNPPGAIVVLAWNFFDVIVKNNQALVDLGVKFINIKDLQNPNFEV